MLVIVPNQLRDAIHAAINKELGGRPCSDADREILYQQLLSYFNDNGIIPDFSLKDPPAPVPQPDEDDAGREYDENYEGRRR